VTFSGQDNTGYLFDVDFNCTKISENHSESQYFYWRTTTFRGATTTHGGEIQIKPPFYFFIFVYISIYFYLLFYDWSLGLTLQEQDKFTDFLSRAALPPPCFPAVPITRDHHPVITFSPS
jgi:hypothetical protein